MSIEKTIQERASTYGSFSESARISQGLKTFIVNTPGYAELTAVQRESIDLICTKLSRILSHKAGADHIDNWHDIQGYARLAEQELIDAHWVEQNRLAQDRRGEGFKQTLANMMEQADPANEIPA